MIKDKSQLNHMVDFDNLIKRSYRFKDHECVSNDRYDHECKALKQWNEANTK